MSLMPWDPVKFDVKVQAMNHDHEHIVALINGIHDADAAKAPKAVVLRLLDELGAFTTEHFRDEEALMDFVAFPELLRHRSMHEQLLKDFARHRGAFASGGGRVSPQFFDFLKLWLTAHIRNIDVRYGQFVAQRNPELLEVA